MAVILASKYSSKLAERFTHESFTERACGNDYDWSGVDTINVYTVNEVAIADYSRYTDPSIGSRFGPVAELGDTTQTLVLSQDKSFAFTIDKGNKQEQLNIKSVNKRLKRIWDESITPMIDAYRLSVWAEGAGLTGSGTLTKSNIVEAIMTANAEMSNQLVPLKNRFIFVGNSTFVKCKLSDQIHYSDSLATSAYKNGEMGHIDGIPVIAVPDTYLDGYGFLIKYKSSSADPVTLKTLRAHTDPPGLDGDLGEGRIRYDSFVLDTKKNGIYAYTVS